jgi:putative DNA primase/helicase
MDRDIVLDLVISAVSYELLTEMKEFVEQLDDFGVTASYQRREAELRPSDAAPTSSPPAPTGELAPVVAPVEVKVEKPEPKKFALVNTAMRLPCTEFGNAQRMFRRFGEDLMFVEDLGQWFLWTSTYWKHVSEFHVLQLAQVTVNTMHWESKWYEDEERLKFLKWCLKSQERRMLTNMEELLKLEPALRVRTDQLDAHTHLLGTKNGAVDLRTGKLVAPDRAARITTTAAVEYDEAAKCPVWEATLRGVFCNDDKLIGYFQRLLGYTLMGNPKEDVLVIPFGSGSNGKSTTLGVVRTLLGGYARSAAAATFMDNDKGGSAGGPREDILRLRGARFVYVSEPDENSELREGLVKSMTGGDAMPARGVNAKKTVEVLPTWVPFIPTNHRPIIKGSDYAIWRRLMTIPFLAKFDKERTHAQGGADNDRKGKLMAEMPGILAWMVRGALDYQKQGLGVPEAVREAKEAYREDMDLLKGWLEDCCELGAGKFATNEELWESWQEHAGRSGDLKFISTSRALGRRLSSGERFEAKARTFGGRKQRGYLGLCVRAVPQGTEVTQDSVRQVHAKGQGQRTAAAAA